MGKAIFVGPIAYWISIRQMITDQSEQASQPLHEKTNSMTGELLSVTVLRAFGSKEKSCQNALAPRHLAGSAKNLFPI